MKRGSAFRITQLLVIEGKAIRQTAPMASWLTGARIWMAPNPRRLSPDRTAHVNCPKRLPSLIGFCVCILESGARQSRRPLSLRRPVNRVRNANSCARRQATRRYKVTGCKSWNCILVPGLTTVVPAVCPYRACRAVCGGPCGSTLLVFTATLRPFTETDASSTESGTDLRGLRREELTFPNAFVPAFNTTCPLTETS